MIKLQQVSKVYHEVTAVNNISFEVKEGENVVLLGTSGCGKTTTLRMINRLSHPTSGNIKVNGRDINLQSPEKLRQGIGYVLQHNGLFPHYTIAENIAVVPTLLKWSKEKIKKRTVELLEKLHLPAERYTNMYPVELSGGQQQRIGLARALAADPPILLMDEPFGALDPVTRTAIRKDFSNLEEFKKKTIVLVTHDVMEAFELGDRICLMDKGKIIQMGTPAELLFKPATDFVRDFFYGNRLLLELQAISVQDIFDYLPANPGADNEVELPLHASLAVVLDALSGLHITQKNPLLVAVRQGTNKQLDITAVMAAYISYKKAVYE